MKDDDLNERIQWRRDRKELKVDGAEAHYFGEQITCYNTQNDLSLRGL
jgi:hypothetical protein